MKPIDQKALLMERIVILQNKQVQDFEILKNQYQMTIISLKPMNLIKDALMDVTSSTNIKSNLLNGTFNLATGLLSKNLLFGIADKPLKRLANIFLNFWLKKSY